MDQDVIQHDSHEAGCFDGHGNDQEGATTTFNHNVDETRISIISDGNESEDGDVDMHACARADPVNSRCTINMNLIII